MLSLAFPSQRICIRGEALYYLFMSSVGTPFSNSALVLHISFLTSSTLALSAHMGRD